MMSMTDEERARLREASRLHRPLAKAADVGRRNGTSIAICGLLTLLASGFGPDLLGLAIGCVVTVTGFIERRVAPRLLRADAGAAVMLARNELALMAGIVVYALIQISLADANSAELSRQVGGTGDMGLDIADLSKSLTQMIYVTVAAVTVLYQGGMARYFLRRREHAAAYLAGAPDWARDLVEGLSD